MTVEPKASPPRSRTLGLGGGTGGGGGFEHIQTVLQRRGKKSWHDDVLGDFYNEMSHDCAQQPQRRWSGVGRYALMPAAACHTVQGVSKCVDGCTVSRVGAGGRSRDTVYLASVLL